MTKDFGQEMKQKLADLLGGELLESYTIAFNRGRDRFLIEPFGYVEDERLLGLRIRCRLDRAGQHDADVGDLLNPRPRVDGLPQLDLRRVTAQDRKGSRWGLDRRVRTADPSFDEVVHVESNAPDKPLQAVLRSPETRGMVKTLLEHCDSISINKVEGELAVRFRTHEQDEESLPRLVEQLERLIEVFLSLRASLPLFVGDTRAIRLPLLKWAYLTELLLLILGFIGGGVTAALDMAPIDDQPIVFLLTRALFAVALFVPLAWLIARGRTRGAWHFRMLVFLTLFVFPMCTLGLGIATNALFDTSPPQKHRLEVMTKPDCSRNRESVDVKDWREGGGAFNLTVRGRACRRVEQGDTMVVVVREGFWGWPWISDFGRIPK